MVVVMVMMVEGQIIVLLMIRLVVIVLKQVQFDKINNAYFLLVVGKVVSEVMDESTQFHNRLNTLAGR